MGNIAGKYEYDAMVIKSLIDAGYTVKAISDKIGIPYQAAYHYITNKKYDPEYEMQLELKDIQKKNEVCSMNKAKRRKRRCRSCQYRGDGRKNGCDYIYITGHMRGCMPDQCFRYVMGSRLRCGNNDSAVPVIQGD